jgi:small subunit ribosomal protein S1
MAVIDVGLKTEGRVALREFAGPAVTANSRSATKSKCFSTGSKTHWRSRSVARQGSPRRELGQAREGLQQANEKRHGVIFNQVKGGFTVDLDGAVAFLPRSQVDIRPIRDVAPR